jgi:uncharacterized protein (DUF2147 family)
MIWAALLALGAQAAPQGSIEGQWRSPGGNSIIGVAPCGKTMCGTVIWASARAKQDARKATDQLIGTSILTGLKQEGGGWLGRLFIPDKNMRVTAKLRLIGDGQMRVAGCALGKSLCKSAVWTRADGPLPPAE